MTLSTITQAASRRRSRLLSLASGALLVGSVALLSAQTAHAQVSFTLASATATTTASSEAFFTGTITNLGATTVFLNGLNIVANVGTTPANAFGTPDTNPFFNNAPLSLTAAGTGAGSTYTGQLFGIPTTSFFTSTSKFLGTATLVGGPNNNSSNTLGTPQNITVTAAATSPEPGSVALALTGILAGGFTAIRRRSRG